MKRIFILLFPILLLTASCGQQQSYVKNTPVAAFDTSKLAGTWYEIARYEYWSEMGIDKVKLQLQREADGSFSVEYDGVLGEKAKHVEGTIRTTDSTSVFKGCFWWPLYKDYRILMTDDDCSYLVVGAESSEYLWILAREKTIPSKTLYSILYLLSAHHYDTDRLAWLKHEAL